MRFPSLCESIRFINSNIHSVRACLSKTFVWCTTSEKAKGFIVSITVSQTQFSTYKKNRQKWAEKKWLHINISPVITCLYIYKFFEDDDDRLHVQELPDWVSEIFWLCQCTTCIRPGAYQIWWEFDFVYVSIQTAAFMCFA